MINLQAIVTWFNAFPFPNFTHLTTPLALAEGTHERGLIYTGPDTILFSKSRIERGQSLSTGLLSSRHVKLRSAGPSSAMKESWATEKNGGSWRAERNRVRTQAAPEGDGGWQRMS